MARFNYLPEELVINVLSWLPADSLMRFKCVTKSWYSLIENSMFKAKQLHNHVRSASNDELCVLLRHLDLHVHERGQNILSFLTYDDKIRATLRGDDFPFRINPVSNLPFYEDCHQFLETLGGSCDGMIFFYHREMLGVANPGIRRFKILPKSCIFVPPPIDHIYQNDYDDYVEEAVGLGYDPKTNDYKIVRVWDIWKYGGYLSQRAEVYTFSSNSWKEIDNHVMKMEIDNVIMRVSIDYMPCFERYWNGAYYWYAEAQDTLEDNSESIKNIIALFDMTYEVFRCIVMPESFQHQYDAQEYYYCGLIELNGSLALFHYLVEKSFNIWVMDEFGVNGTWANILCSGPLPGIERPLLFVKGDVLLMEAKGGQLVSYNLKTKQVQRLPIYGKAKCFQAMLYKHSLILS